MSPDQIGEIINQQIRDATDRIQDRTFYRGVVSAVKGQLVDVKIEGSATAMPNIVCLGSYIPAVNDVVLLVSIGRTGANFIVMDKINISPPITNLILNPSAETNMDGWTIYSGYGGRTNQGVYGTQAVYIQNASPGGTIAYTTQNLEAGKTYTMSLWSRHTGGITTVEMIHNSTILNTSYNSGILWNRHSKTFVAGANTPIFIYITKSTSDTIAYIDGLMLTEGSTLYTYFDGVVVPSGGGGAVQWNGTAHASTSQWHPPSSVNAWIYPTFQNGWVNYDVVYNQAGYRKDRLGNVYLKGLIKNGTMGAAAFTLPAGYRPAARQLHGTTSNGATGRVDIEANGVVIPNGGSNAWITLDGIVFKAEL